MYIETGPFAFSPTLSLMAAGGEGVLRLYILFRRGHSTVSWGQELNAQPILLGIRKK